MQICGAFPKSAPPLLGGSAIIFSLPAGFAPRRAVARARSGPSPWVSRNRPAFVTHNNTQALLEKVAPAKLEELKLRLF